MTLPSDTKYKELFVQRHNNPEVLERLLVIANKLYCDRRPESSATLLKELKISHYVRCTSGTTCCGTFLDNICVVGEKIPM
jgi:hypothetical protein